MAKSKFFSLWGQKAEEQESEEDKKAREAREAEEQKKKKDEEASADDEEDEDEAEDEDDLAESDKTDEEAKAEAAKVSPRAAAFIRRAERQRVHAIVQAAGPGRVEAGLHLALGTKLSAKAARGVLAATPASTSPPPGGHLGLGADMATRRATPLGPAAGAAVSDVDKAASSIAAFVSRPAADRE